MPVLALLVGCSGTWVDDPANFKRVFGFSAPKDVQVTHSYYWKSPHWSTEYRYFIELSASKGFTDGLTSVKLMVPVAPDSGSLNSCGSTHPSWFLPKSVTSYDAWYPKSAEGYRDKIEGALFLCDERL
jgi:hypothetical protein